MSGRTALWVSVDGVKRLGLEEPPGKALEWTGDMLAVKFPGQTYWVGRGMERGYAGARIVVFQWRPADSDRGGWWHEVLEWTVRKEKK